jgi:hypothetical protein
MAVPPGNHRGSDLRRTFQYIARFACPACPELVAGSLSKEHRRTPGFRLCKTGRRRRQGHLRNKAHPEPLRSPQCKGGLPDFVRHPAKRQGLTSILSMTRLCAFVDLSASGGADHPASRHPIAAALSAELRVPSLSREKPLPQRSSSQRLQRGGKGGQSRSRRRGGSCIMRASL